jgi:hypothetical protein
VAGISTRRSLFRPSLDPFSNRFLVTTNSSQGSVPATPPPRAPSLSRIAIVEQESTVSSMIQSSPCSVADLLTMETYTQQYTREAVTCRSVPLIKELVLSVNDFDTFVKENTLSLVDYASQLQCFPCYLQFIGGVRPSSISYRTKYGVKAVFPLFNREGKLQHWQILRVIGRGSFGYAVMVKKAEEILVVKVDAKRHYVEWEVFIHTVVTK